MLNGDAHHSSVKVRIELRMGRCRVVKYESGARIAKSLSGVIPSPGGLASKGFLTVCDCLTLTVRLHTGGRYFTCPFCRRVREHPPFDPYACPDAHAYCDQCGRSMRIENFRTFKSEEEWDATRRR